MGRRQRRRIREGTAPEPAPEVSEVPEVTVQAGLAAAQASVKPDEKKG
jgi:hypothetical protein